MIPQNKTITLLPPETEKKMIIHNIPPLYDKNSKILILGSFPSVKSREARFFYGHPQNRFWRLLSALLCDRTPVTAAEKRSFLLKNNIAVWDVIKSCDIEGSSDSSIKNVIPNDLNIILNYAKIKQIFTNGSTSYKYFHMYNKDKNAVCLPSTSPANASYSMERLLESWKIIKDYLS